MIFLLNIFLMLAWVVLTGRYTLAQLCIGFLLGYLVLWMLSPINTSTHYFRRTVKIIALMLYFMMELAKSNLRVAYDIITPRHRMRPAILAVPLDLESDMGITLLATLITLTPGTLSLDVSTDRRTLYVHDMYIDTPEIAIRKIKHGFERRIREVLEP